MASVYAPFSGNIYNLDTYCCCGSTHTNVGGQCGSRPADIFGGQGTAVCLYVSNCLSCSVSHYNGVCRSDPAPWTHGVSCDCYSGYNCTGSYLGCVSYGHLTNRCSTGTHNNPWGLWLGSLPADCACTCSSGVHVHMESTIGRCFTQNCSWASVIAGYTKIYC